MLFPQVAILGEVVTKMLDHRCRRMILITLGWMNMPWFWYLVNLSVKIPLSLPRLDDLLTQPFSGCPHRHLQNLNLHAWLLESQPSRNKGSVTKW